MKTIFENELICVESTGRDYDFIATVENKTDKKIRIHYKDMDLLDTYDTIDVEPDDWVGLLADAEVGFGHLNLDRLKSKFWIELELKEIKIIYKI